MLLNLIYEFSENILNKIFIKIRVQILVLLSITNSLDISKICCKTPRENEARPTHRHTPCSACTFRLIDETVSRLISSSDTRT